MKKLLILFLLILTLSILGQLRVYAGGPLVVKGNMSVTYGTRPYLYRYDKGPLGMFSNSEAISIIEDLYDDWQAVKTSELKFKRDEPGSLDFDVTASNFKSILDSQDLLGYTPVIFDNDGSLLEEFLGKGAGNSVLGLSGPVTVNSGPFANQIAESQAVFNGRFVNGVKTPSDPESTIDSLKGTIIHETGHGLGLDHSQINLESIKPGASQDLRDSVPLLFPVAVNELFVLRRDDVSAISSLYPNESELGKFGKIQGKILRHDGTTPVLGANVIAKNITDPKLEAISCVSDYLKVGNGEFLLFAVPAGDYKIQVEPIDLSFTGGSGVGPYSTTTTDLSFQNPVQKGFYAGPNMDLVSDESQALTITIKEGQVVEDINILTNDTLVTTSSSGGSGNVNEVEPNDSVSKAQSVIPPVAISGNAAKSDDGSIELASQDGQSLVISDLFKFTVGGTSTINALLTIENPDADLDLALFNGDATDIIESSSQLGSANELISLKLNPGNYILGIGAFKGSTKYKLEITLGGAPSLELSGPDSIILIPSGNNNISIKAQGSNFKKKTKCTAKDNSKGTLMLTPKSFNLGSGSPKKSIRVKVNPAAIPGLLETNEEKTFTIDVTCTNKASDQKDITIFPSLDTTISSKKNWQIIKRIRN